MRLLEPRSRSQSRRRHLRTHRRGLQRTPVSPHRPRLLRRETALQTQIMLQTWQQRRALRIPGVLQHRTHRCQPKMLLPHLRMIQHRRRRSEDRIYLHLFTYLAYLFKECDLTSQFTQVMQSIKSKPIKKDQNLNPKHASKINPLCIEFKKCKLFKKL